MVQESQVPLNPRGNDVFGDYELTYTAEAPFSFPGGGLLIGFQASPPAIEAHGGCQQVLVTTSTNDAIAGDPDGNHVGTATNGVLGSRPTTSIGTRMNDGDIFYSWICYDGIADQLEVRRSNPTSGS